MVENTKQNQHNAHLYIYILTKYKYFNMYIYICRYVSLIKCFSCRAKTGTPRQTACVRSVLSRGDPRRAGRPSEKQSVWGNGGGACAFALRRPIASPDYNCTNQPGQPPNGRNRSCARRTRIRSEVRRICTPLAEAPPATARASVSSAKAGLQDNQRGQVV